MVIEFGDQKLLLPRHLPAFVCRLGAVSRPGGLTMRRVEAGEAPDQVVQHRLRHVDAE